MRDIGSLWSLCFLRLFVLCAARSDAGTLFDGVPGDMGLDQGETRFEVL
jgi:hypothetical protein